MDCSACGKEDLQDYEQYSINDTWYYLCLEDDNSCENRVKQAILRTIHILREQHGLTLFDNGVPMNPQIGGMAIGQPEWVAREVPQPEAFFNQLDGFLYNLLDWLLIRTEECAKFTHKSLQKLASISLLLRKRFGRR